MCIQTDVLNRPAAFIEGHISQILNNTKQYAVQCGINTRTVRRGQIRLLRPPWWDELSDMSSNGLTGVPSQASTTSMPVKYEAAAADANTIRSIVHNSASSAKSQQQQQQHQQFSLQLPIGNDLATTSGGTTSTSVPLANFCSGSSNSKSLPSRSRPFCPNKFEPISLAHSSISSVSIVVQNNVICD